MTKKTRTILFFICVFLFILIAPSVVFYSQGYRFDFEKKKVTQTGAFYFKVLPQSAEIYLDGKLKKKTDFFFGTAFVKNLLPRKYTIEIKKEDFLIWSKTIEIKEKEVQEFKNIVLVPENPNFPILTKGVNDFFFSPDGKEIILRKSGKEGWYLTLFDPEKKVESVLIEGQKLSPKATADFLNLKFSPDSKKILLEGAIGESEKYFLLELDKPSPLSPILLDFLENPEKISFHPQNSQKLFFLKNKKLFEADYETKKISEPILTDLVNYEILNSSIFWLDSSGFLFTSDLSGKTQEKINSEPFPLKSEVQYKIIVSSANILVLEDDTFYLFDKTSKIFKEIRKLVNEVKFSGDFKKVFYFSDYEIWLCYLEDILEQPSKKTRETQLIARFSEKIGDVFWLTNHYLIFKIENKAPHQNFGGGKIKIAEIDERDKIQIWDLPEFKEPPKESKLPTEQAKIFFNQRDKKLYLLSEGDLYTSESLIK